MGVGAEVVGGKGLGPTAGVAVFEDGGHHAFLQCGVVYQEERGRGVGEVNRVDTAVGVVLFREEKDVAVVVLKQLVGGDNLTIGGAEQLGVFLSARLETVVVDDFVLLAAAGHDVVVVGLKLVKGLEDGLAVACPVTFIVFVEITDVENFVVADEHVAAGRADGAEVMDVGQCGEL